MTDTDKVIRVREALRARVQTARQFFLEGVRSADARVDAMAFSLGAPPLSVHGFEIKVSRYDWLAELENPRKAATGMRACDCWWLVTIPDVIEDLAEVPSMWGVLVLDGAAFREAREASILTPNPAARGDALLIAALRRVRDTMVHRDAVREMASVLAKTHADPAFVVAAAHQRNRTRR